MYDALLVDKDSSTIIALKKAKPMEINHPIIGSNHPNLSNIKIDEKGTNLDGFN
jgi:hypothetical protein